MQGLPSARADLVLRADRQPPGGCTDVVFKSINYLEYFDLINIKKSKLKQVFLRVDLSEVSTKSKTLGERATVKLFSFSFLCILSSCKHIFWWFKYVKSGLTLAIFRLTRQPWRVPYVLWPEIVRHVLDRRQQGVLVSQRTQLISVKYLHEITLHYFAVALWALKQGTCLVVADAGTPVMNLSSVFFVLAGVSVTSPQKLLIFVLSLYTSAMKVS